MKKTIEVMVGFFMLFGMLCLLVLAFKVSGLHEYMPGKTYRVTAVFDNIGGLRVRAPLRIAGVHIGEVSDIQLDPKTYRAVVGFVISEKDNNIPVDSALSILTEGLLGTNYVGLMPGFDKEMLKNGDRIEETHPAIILESLIGRFLYQLKGDNDSDKKDVIAKTEGGDAVKSAKPKPEPKAVPVPVPVPAPVPAPVKTSQ